MKINQIRTFLPSKDFEVSKSFYQELGFKLIWEDKELAILGDENQNFFLQKYYVKEWAENLMMQLFVDNLDETFKKVTEVANKYKCKVHPMFEAEYGRTFHLLGPSGELWHISQAENKNNRDIICDE